MTNYKLNGLMTGKSMKNTLPEDFLEILKKVYPDSYSTILETFDNDLPTTFRVNTLKSNIKEVGEELESAEIKVKKGPFDNSFIVIEDKKELISRTNLVTTGKIYMQELSSMIPPIIIDPKEHDFILDLTAAPGSKTTELASMCKDKAKILANEKSYVRFQKLKFNLNLQGCVNVKTTNENGMFLHKKYPEFVNFFDKVMLDAPCSSEGRFYTYNTKTFKYWNKHKIKEMASIQKGLLKAGIEMLKPGGFLLYSTCTINPTENEQNINWLISKIPNLEIENIEIGIDNKINGLTKFDNFEFDESIFKTIRILPNENFGAFYLAKIRKK